MAAESMNLYHHHYDTPFERVNRAELELIRYLRRSKDQFAAIFYGVAEGIIVRNPAGGLVYANDAASSMLGYPSHESLLAAPDEDAMLSRVHVLNEAGQPFSLHQLPWRMALRGVPNASAVLRFRIWATGQERIAMVRSAPIFNEMGQVQLEVSTITDITERKKAEEEAEAKSRLLQALFETSPVGILMVDTCENVLYANSELNRIFGLSAEAGTAIEPYRKGVAFHRPDGTPYDADHLPLIRALRGAEIARAEEIHLHFDDGRVIPVLSNATPVLSPDGKITGAVEVIQDITPLEEAQKARNEFLAVVSHEMRNPLTIIKGMAMTAQQSPWGVRPAEAREMFQIIDQEADRLRDLVDNLLDINRIESGTLSINLQPIAAEALLKEALEKYQLGGGAHQVHVQMADVVPPIRADQGRILQVLMNLLSNASKFSPLSRPIFIEVSAGPEQVTLQVRDRGRGIPHDRLPLLFRKFTRVHPASVDGPPGTGLGLAICKGIVEAHGGRIWAESPGEGKGATFSFTLPVAAATAPVQSPASLPADTPAGTNDESNPPLRVLVVDDDSRILRILKRALSRAGFEVLLITEPSEAVELGALPVSYEAVQQVRQPLGRRMSLQTTP